MPENSYYLEALVDGESEIIHSIYNEVLPKVIKFVYQNKGDENNAREIFQNALLQLSVRYRKEKFVIHTSFEAYLFTVCKNLWRRELNRKKIEVTNDNVLELRDDTDDLARAIVEQKQWELFNDAIDKLSENCKIIMKLFFKKTPYAKMLELLNYNSETVIRQRVFKCKAKLKSLIKSDKRYKDLKQI